MDYAFYGKSQSRDILSSLSNCKTHKVLFEASIAGLVTTKQNSGSLPIGGVSVSWELLSVDLETPLICSGCSGNEITTAGGSFHIQVKVDDDIYYNGNNDEFPIRIKYKKQTVLANRKIDHEFLCNEGLDVCDSSVGDVVYLSHLQFNKPLHIYDDTSTPFKGKVIVDNTVHEGSPGCGVFNATICLMHNFGEDRQAELGCAISQSNGDYNVPVAIGSIVHDIQVSYHSHEFTQTESNVYNYDEGIHITEEGLYIDHDFRDITTTTLIVEGAFKSTKLVSFFFLKYSQFFSCGRKV